MLRRAVRLLRQHPGAAGRLSQGVCHRTGQGGGAAAASRRGGGGGGAGGWDPPPLPPAASLDDGGLARRAALRHGAAHVPRTPLPHGLEAIPPPTKTGGASVECCRKCTVRRVGASYKASGPDASGAYDASYSVVQGVGARRVGDVRRVVQCRTRCRTVPTPYDTVRHSTTQYDTVRHSTTQYDTVRHGTTQYDTVLHTDMYICRHINTCKWKKKQIGQNGAKWVQMRFHFGQNSPKGETSNIGTSRLQHADNVYN